ncbi:MAG: hypothetical protein ACNI27_02585 [Desulfovibrio sp.]
MIDKSSAISTIKQKLTKLPVGHCLDLRTYKRDRSVVIRKDDENTYLFIVNGFSKERITVSVKKLERTLKGLLKKEFPRSNKIRLYDLGKTDANEASTVKR